MRREDPITGIPTGGKRMKRLLVILSALVSALAIPVSTGHAAQAGPPAQISFVSVTANWHDPTDNVPGSQPGDPVITNGIPTSIIRWGVTSGPQSGYDFTTALPPSQTFPGPI